MLGAAGGVGTTAIEIGKALGARVIAAASSGEKLAFAKSVGADETINYVDDDLRNGVRSLTNDAGVDVVYDPVGGELALAALRSCGWQARYLVVGFASGQIPQIPANLPLLKEATIHGVFWGQWASRNPQRQAANLRELMTMFDRGTLTPRITREYALDDYVTAYADLAGRRTTGKSVFLMR